MAKPPTSDVVHITGLPSAEFEQAVQRDPASEAPPARDEAAPPGSRRLARRRSIALIHDGSNPPMLLAAQQGVLEAVQGSRYALILTQVERDPVAVLQQVRTFLEEHRPAGVLLLPPLSDDATLLRVCRDYSGAAPAEGGDEPVQSVASADRLAAADAVQHLIAMGHTRIGFVTGAEGERSARERELGYLDAMAEHQLDRGPLLIANGDNSFESGIAAGQMLLEVSPRASAIFAGNDEMAAGVIHAARAKNIAVPDALSVVGFEDSWIAARISPALTSVRIPITDMTRAAVRGLIDPASSAHELSEFVPELVVRSSTAPYSG